MYTRRAINSRIKQRVALLVVLLFSVIFSETAGAQKVAVRNNLLYDLTLTPNLGLLPSCVIGQRGSLRTVLPTGHLI